jgi:hypothetical protein
MDSKAKLIDFGLSCLLNVAEIQVDVKRMDALHWKSPEYLTGGRPSFAMCILKAVTGDIPWGKEMSLAFVKFQVKKGNIPILLDILSDKRGSLIAAEVIVKRRLDRHQKARNLPAARIHCDRTHCENLCGL